MTTPVYMNSYKYIKSGVRLILLFALVSFLSTFVKAQDSTAMEEESKPSLELKLTSDMPSFCIDSKVSLELAVTNVSHEEVVVDMTKLWTQFSYSSRDDTDQVGKAGGMGIGTTEMDKQLVVLYPGNTVRSSYEFSVAFEFFQAKGNYTLQAGFNSILSDEVKFTLYDCGKTQKIEDK